MLTFYVIFDNIIKINIIRSKGIEANHEIIILNESDAKQLINFIQMIISVIYKMKFEANKYLNQ